MIGSGVSTDSQETVTESQNVKEFATPVYLNTEGD